MKQDPVSQHGRQVVSFRSLTTAAQLKLIRKMVQAPFPRTITFPQSYDCGPIEAAAACIEGAAQAKSVTFRSLTTAAQLKPDILNRGLVGTKQRFPQSYDCGPIEATPLKT